MTQRRLSPRPVGESVLVTGGCGFVGCNIADALASRGQSVLILDNLARSGVSENAQWLRRRHDDLVTIVVGDIRDADLVLRLVCQASAVLHLAAQVAVTTSLDNPIEDFETNARGTLNLLEAVRRIEPSMPLIYASTNKVYGRLFDDDEVRRGSNRYRLLNTRLERGVSEEAPLDLYSPYGCSKGAADQYVRDYARVFGLRTVVMRMSCIYGPRQFGTEDQGWLAHFMLRAIRGEGITIYGDGFQVRDVLYVGDAVQAWLLALDQIEKVAGCVLNLGGGGENSVSLREMIAMIGDLNGSAPALNFRPWRPGDQPWYVSDIGRIHAALGWAPQVGVNEGLRQLEAWLYKRFGDSAPAPELREAHA
jgi:CDP-paratose 2-epimerase